MKKYLALLLLLLPLTFFACPQHKPPVPPPQDVCGDLRCTGSETPASCPSDCPGGPVPPVCGDGDCVAPETPESCAKDCGVEPPEPPLKPKYTPGDPILQCGMWEALSQPADWYDFYFKTLYEKTNTNSVGVHVLTPWGALEYKLQYQGKSVNVGFFPWMFDKKKFQYNLDQSNELWWTNFELFLATAKKYGFHVHLKLFDQYSDPKLFATYTGPGLSKFHPLLHNNYGVKMSDHMLYDNWDRSGTADTDFAWLIWTGNDADPTSKYRLRPIGKVFQAYITRVAKLIKKYDLPTTYTVLNEERAQMVFDGQRWHSDPARSLGGQDKIRWWIRREIFKPEGLTFGPKFGETTDFIAYKAFIPNGNPYKYDLEWGAMLGGSKYIREHEKNVHEIHQCGTVAVVDFFKSHGMDFTRPDFLCSNDGIVDGPKNPNLMKNQTAQIQAWHQGKIRNLEYKFALTTNQYWHPDSHKQSVEEMLPRIVKELDKGWKIQ